MQQCTESGVISWKSYEAIEKEREKESDKMHACTQTSNERCIKIKGTRKFNWCQCTTTSLSLLTKCSTRTSRSVFPDGFSFFTFLFPTLCHNRNESALQMLKIEMKKNGSKHTQKNGFSGMCSIIVSNTLFTSNFLDIECHQLSPPSLRFPMKMSIFLS